MSKMLLKKKSIKDLLMNVSQEFETYIPLETLGGDVQFMKKEDSLNGLNLDYEFLIIPPKVIAFPQLESLFKFKDGKIKETVKPSRKRLLFGLRACDAKAISFMDDFFKRNFEDSYYLNRSKNRLAVIVGCKKPSKNCFCISAKSGPFLSLPDSNEKGKYDEFDLQMIDIGDEYLVEIGSKEGEEFVKKYKKYFNRASKDDIERSKTAKHDAEEAVSLKVDFEKAIKKFCEDKVSKETYERIAERCIYCGGCLYVCPTCSCFNVFDDGLRDLGTRFRNWDTCVFDGYTREASGNNPRPEKWNRTSRRYEHKLKYDYLATGVSGCVGCGRCLSSCPVDIGISKLIEEVLTG